MFITMKIAVTYDNDNREVFQHFGHTSQFKIYDVSEGKVVSSKIIQTDSSGHGALASFLHGEGVNALICGGIGGGAKLALSEARIDVYPGASGNADHAVEELLAGSLTFDLDTDSAHRRSGDMENHACGEHGCGRK
jgi:predicted Fe-Mo cluster-binding NifX family protein